MRVRRASTLILCGLFSLGVFGASNAASKEPDKKDSHGSDPTSQHASAPAPKATPPAGKASSPPPAKRKPFHLRHHLPQHYKPVPPERRPVLRKPITGPLPHYYNQGSSDPGAPSGASCTAAGQCQRGLICVDSQGNAPPQPGSPAMCGSATLASWFSGGAPPPQATSGSGASCSSDGQCGNGLGCDPTSGQCRACGGNGGSFCCSSSDCPGSGGIVDIECENHQCYSAAASPSPSSGGGYCPCLGYPNTPEGACAMVECMSDNVSTCGTPIIGTCTSDDD
jgi:hypothetical protein